MASHDVLASLWARARVDDLMGQDFQGLQSGNMREDLKDTITQLGIEYRLMTQFTSFVARPGGRWSNWNVYDLLRRKF
jgi:hypothetical protein